MSIGGRDCISRMSMGMGCASRLLNWPSGGCTPKRRFSLRGRPPTIRDWPRGKNRHRLPGPRDPKNDGRTAKEEPATKQVSNRGRSQGTALGASMNLRAKDGRTEQQDLGVLKGTRGKGSGSGVDNVHRSSLSPLFHRNAGKSSAPASHPKR